MMTFAENDCPNCNCASRLTCVGFSFPSSTIPDKDNSYFTRNAFSPPKTPTRENYALMLKKLEKIGIEDRFGGGPNKEQFLELLDDLGLTENLNRRRIKKG